MSCLALSAKEPQDDIMAVCPECGVLLCYANVMEDAAGTYCVKLALEAAARRRHTHVTRDNQLGFPRGKK